MKVLVLGDQITDFYRWNTATRICPEAPVPVLIEINSEVRNGGAGLVADQLRELIGKENVLSLYGTKSRKERIFADNRLLCRIDNDAEPPYPEFDRNAFTKQAISLIDENYPKAIIISDYGKGTLDKKSSGAIMKTAAKWKTPVFVDAKKSWDQYFSAYAMFPNEQELCFTVEGTSIIQKLGPRGCSVNGFLVPQESSHAVMDVTGAGDIFLAAFVAKFVSTPLDCPPSSGLIKKAELIECAKFANKVAGRSVEFIGTKIVDDIKL